VVRSSQNPKVRGLRSNDAIGTGCTHPLIGRKNRWFGPNRARRIFYGDGLLGNLRSSLPPHLSGLRATAFLRKQADFTRLATAEGYTNHRIGDAEIAGNPHLVVAAARVDPAQMPMHRASARTRLVALHLNGKALSPP